MSEPATITVTRGPARGQFFELEAELVHIGRAESNQVVLEDTNLADHQASIVFRNGRYAIFTPLPDAVSIDGSAIPPQRWVWLPGEADIGLGQRTSLRFATSLPNAASDNGDAEDGPAGNGQRKGRKGRRRKRQLAKFVTDAQGESRVQLGEDGQLPELSLDEELTGGKIEQKKSGSNSLLLSLVLVVSTALSIMLLIVEGPGIGTANRGFEFARTELKKMLEDTKPKTDAQPELAWRLLVRDALSAAARSDRTGEQVAYDRLLNLLNAEDRRKSSLTGDEARDQRLKEMIATLKAP
ncbi:MAG TPA: hypothetical protein DIC23_04165 [Planctomycetaceae bacterium]|nr:hypothetical protein [Planctomycetaceae bacterium]